MVLLWLKYFSLFNWRNMISWEKIMTFYDYLSVHF